MNGTQDFSAWEFNPGMSVQPLGTHFDDTIPWAELAGPLIAAEDKLARLDERLTRSPVRDGWIERQNFHDAVAALWIEGELVHLEDLVLHDAHMDVRAPTHELTRAHAFLRIRRQVFANKPDWALSRAGLRQLTGRAGEISHTGEGEAVEVLPTAAPEAESDGDAALAAEFAAIDAVLERSRAVLAGVAPPSRPPAPVDRDPLIYDPDWDENGRLEAWLDVLARAADLPPVLRAAVLWDTWETEAPLQHAPWLGVLLVGAMLRQYGKTTAHLANLTTGLRLVAREKRRHRSRTVRLLAFLDAVSEAAALGLKEHDRLVLAREQMTRRLKGRRGHSKLPRLIDFALSRPLVSSAMIEKELKVTTRGALNLVAELGLREITGRGRYRAWGVV
ncbi:RHE_PE00001 family protein [Mesorhizobium sp. LHD-90]|uniref:RHE_PE00001 family protein n=1 Tax=Mesorhizobium sp. LHD-90 TaxID=3071414 RepID=UPI0027DFEF3C|nr:RHE_PE00001 family protein [Mesorhizobium sp. LHD-90]MDQ6438076.1 RHE_PE00001 family protein [Mesorhizobium sp. LHD-90]